MAVSSFGTNSFDIKIKFDFDMGDAASQIKQIVKDGIKYALTIVVKDFKELFILPMIYGGRGWYSIVQTNAWRWLNSPAGYGQMGFNDAREPLKLLQAYEEAWYVKLVNDTSIEFGFGDIELLREKTKHPAAGKGNLPINRSWLDWLYEGVHYVVEPAKFRKTGPKPGVRSSKIAGASAGRMIKYKKDGASWQVLPRNRLNMDTFLARNRDKIQSQLERSIAAGIDDYLAGA